MTPISLYRLLPLLGAVLVATAPAHAELAPLNVPILLHGAVGQDACAERGHIFEVGEGAEAALTVQGGPGEGFREVGRLHAGDAVSVCEHLGPWLGVVYGSEPLGCQTTIILPTQNQKEYTGPCERGWVPARNVSVDPK